MKKITVIILGLLMIGACAKKDVSIKPQDIEGTYAVIYPENHKYVEIGDGFLSFYGTTFGNYGSRNQTFTSPFEKKNNTVSFFDEDLTISWNDQTLTLEGEKIKYVLIKTSDIPKASEWVQSAQVEKLFDQDEYKEGNRIQDLTLYNGHVITSGYRNKEGNYVLGKIHPKDLTVEELSIPRSTMSTLGYNRNLEYMGGGLFWSNIEGASNVPERMYAFDVDTRENTNVINLNGEKTRDAYHMAANSDKTILWGTFYEGIRKYDFINQKWGSIINMGTQMLDGMAINDNHLYIASHGTIHKYTLQPLKAVAAYSIPDNYKTNGIVFINSKEIMATAYDYDTKKDIIIRITLP